MMPNRVLRESLLDSTRYLAVDEGAQLLFTHLILLADDFGCLSLAYSFVGRRCFNNRPTDERLDRLIHQLVDADLLRIYEHSGQRFGFIPRFRQRLKRETLKNPQPPAEFLADDEEAREKFSKLNGAKLKGAGTGRPSVAVGPPAGISSEVSAGQEKGREGKGSEEKRSEAELSTDQRKVLDSVDAVARKAVGKKS